MTAEKKDPKHFSPKFVDALFKLPLPARQALARRFDLPLSEEELVLPTDTPPALSPTSVDKDLSQEETEADALRALMGYGRLARRRDGSHDC